MLLSANAVVLIAENGPCQIAGTASTVTPWVATSAI